MKSDDKHTELIVEPTEAENVTIPENNVTQSPFYKGEDNQFHCDYCNQSFDKFTSLRSHVLRKKAEGHGVWLEEDSDGSISIGKRKEPKPIPPQRIDKVEPHQEPTEPLPDELEHLETLLKEHGIKRRDVVLRSMSLRDPASMQELMWSLDDIGVAKSRQRRIITDYSKWLGVSVPETVIDALSPRDEYESHDRFGRRPYVPEETYEDPRKALLADMELSELIETKKAKIKAEIRELENPRPRYGVDDGRVGELTEEVRGLREKLEDEREKRHQAERASDKAEFDAKLAKKGDAMDKAIDKLEKPVTRLGDLLERIAGGAISSEFPEKPPERKKILGESGIANLIPEEMMD